MEATINTMDEAMAIDNNNSIVKQRIAQVVSNFYDIQKLRIACGNRVVASFNIQLGQAPSTKQEDMDAQSEKLIKLLRIEYSRITDAYVDKKDSIKARIAEMRGTGEIDLIKTKLDYDLISEYCKLLEIEEQTSATLMSLVKEHPLYEAFFKGVLGCGHVMAAVCIAYFDPYKARYASSFWSYAGLNPVPFEDENGNMIHRANSKSYTVDREYVSRDGEVKTKKSITYNPTLKTKLLGVLAPCMIKAGIRRNKETNAVTCRSVYATAYMDYKCRFKSKHPDASDPHANRAAIRYMIKLFVKDLWVAWREVEGLPVGTSYEQEYLGKAPHHWPNLTEWSDEEVKIKSMTSQQLQEYMKAVAEGRVKVPGVIPGNEDEDTAEAPKKRRGRPRKNPQ